MTTKTNIKTFTAECAGLAQKILQRRFDLVKLLSKYETFETANDEIDRSVDALQGIGEEFSILSNPLQGKVIATFFPLNLPLYSLVLFGIAPSAFAKAVYIRPPEVMHEMLTELFEFLNIKSHFPNISTHTVPRYIFMDLYASESDVIIFTGKYENAITIQRRCPQALLIYNGSGVNPFVLFENVDIDLAVDKAIEMRCFNSGQDCAGPDAFFVPTTLANSFVGKLHSKLSQIKVGDTRDPSVHIGPIIKESYIQQLEVELEKERNFLVSGGEINSEQHYVYPTILLKPITKHTGPYHEFFAPVFYVLEYSNDTELEHALSAQEFIDRTMYISIFGANPPVEEKLTFATVLKNQIVNDVERGNTEYGGYGPSANFLLYGQHKTVKPVLISRDMHLVFSGIA